MTATPPSPEQRRSPKLFVESVALTWIGNGGRIVLGLLALRMVTSAIPEQELGAYWILTTVAVLLGSLADLGLGLSIVRHLPITSDRVARDNLVHTVVLLRLATLALLCALIWACRSWIIDVFDAPSLASCYTYLYVFVILNNLSELYTNVLQGLHRFRTIATLAILASVLRLVLILLFVRQLNMGIQGLFAAEAISMAIGCIAASSMSGHWFRFHFDRVEALKQIRFGAPLYLNTLVSYTVSRLNTVMIGGMRGATEVSYFVVAGRVPEQLGLVLRSFVFVLLPSVSRMWSAGERASVERLVASSLRIMGFGFCILAASATLFRHELLRLLAPDRYQVAAPTVALLATTLVFIAMGSILGNTFVAIGDSRTPTKINLATTAISIALNWAMIRAWGFNGAAVAGLTYAAMGYVITDAVLARRMRVHRFDALIMIALMATGTVLGLHAPTWLRLTLLVAASGTCALVLRGLRADLGWVWKAFVHRNPALPLT